ncbi:MAG: hypothetical protein ACXWLH_00505 [Candidatus Saccharimonadales bacterium]
MAEKFDNSASQPPIKAVLSIPRLGIYSECQVDMPLIEIGGTEDDVQTAADPTDKSHQLNIPRLGIGELTPREKSDYLKRSAGRFGLSEHVSFIPTAKI